MYRLRRILWSRLHKDVDSSVILNFLGLILQVFVRFGRLVVIALWGGRLVDVSGLERPQTCFLRVIFKNHST